MQNVTISDACRNKIDLFLSFLETANFFFLDIVINAEIPLQLFFKYSQLLQTLQ